MMLEPLPLPSDRYWIRAELRAPGTPGPSTIARAMTNTPAAAPPAASCERRLRALWNQVRRVSISECCNATRYSTTTSAYNAVVGAQRPEPRADNAT